MRLAVFLGLVATLGAAEGPEAPAPQAVLERAVAAHGGLALLESPPALVLRGAATARSPMGDLRGPGVLYRKGEKERSDRTFEVRGSEQDFVFTWDGEQAAAEVFGRRSERPAAPWKAQVAHRPEAVLVHALRAPANWSVEPSTEPDVVVLARTGEGGPTRLAIDAHHGFVRWVEYSFPYYSGLDEPKVKTRRDLYANWEKLPGGFAVARSLSTEMDGAVEWTFEVQSIERPEELDDALFRLEEEEGLPLPSDELVD